MKVSAIAAAMTCLAIHASPDVRPQVFRATSDLVYVDVTVLDGGRPVTGLTAADFRLLDNGVEQQIEMVTAAPAALNVSLLLDDSYSIDHETSRRQTHGPAGAWIAAAARSAAALLEVDDRLRVVRFASGMREMRDLSGALAAPRYDAPSHLAYGTSLFDAIIAVAVEPTPPDRRHIVIALTDGFDTTSVVGDDIRHRVLERSSAVVHIITAGNANVPTIRPDDRDPSVALQRERRGRTMLQPSSVEELRDGDFRSRGWWHPGFGGYSWILEDLAERTGGQLYESRSSMDFVDALRNSLRLAKTRYLLAYQPTNVDRGGWHTVSVSMRQAHRYRILARAGYHGGTPGSENDVPELYLRGTGRGMATWK